MYVEKNQYLDLLIYNVHPFSAKWHVGEGVRIFEAPCNEDTNPLQVSFQQMLVLIKKTLEGWKLG